MSVDAERLRDLTLELVACESPTGDTADVVLDMAGNVWEWTSTEYPPGERVLRSGSFASPGLAWTRCTMRSHSRPGRP